MKKSLKYIFFSLMIGIASINTSCKKDDESAVTLVGNGTYKLNVLNGTAPVSGAKVLLYASHSNHPLRTKFTDSAGNLDFDHLIEGNYTAVIETSEPYAKIKQEFQVISGQNNQKSVQVKDHTGSISIALVHATDNNKLIEENIGMSIALVPLNDAYNNAKTNEDKFALKAALKNVDEKGKITFENIPTGEYALYKVYDNKILERNNQYTRYTIDRAGHKFYKVNINLYREKFVSKQSWTVKSASRNYDDFEFTNYPVVSLKLERETTDIYAFKFILDNGAEISGKFTLLNYYSSNWNEMFTQGVSVNQKYSAGIPFYVYYRFNEDGELEIRLSSFNLQDSFTGSYDFFTNNQHTIRFE